MSDFGALLSAQAESKRRWAEREAADARWEIAKTNERIAYLLSQHEPVAELGLDREALRAALRYVQHGDLDRMHRERAR